MMAATKRDASLDAESRTGEMIAVLSITSALMLKTA